MRTQGTSTKTSVEQKLQNKNSGTKTAEQKLVGTLRHWVMGTLSASAIRSAEQKLLNKNSETKIGGDPWGPKVQVQKGQWNKNWWETLGTPSAGARKSVEQKQWNKNSRIKIYVDPQTLDDGQVQ